MSEVGTRAAGKQAARPPVERRASVRYHCSLDSTCQPVALPTAGQREEQWQGKVRNLSVGGICLALSRRFEPGTLLFIDLPVTKDGSTRSLTAVVVHATRVDGGWIIGCRFATPLTNDELAALL
jgi:hypothetical protein